jgi:hypothetical protein
VEQSKIAKAAPGAKLTGVSSMTTILRRLLLLACLIAANGVCLSSARAQTPKEAPKASQAHVAQMQRVLRQTMVETGPFHEALPLKRFLQTLQKPGTAVRADQGHGRSLTTAAPVKAQHMHAAYHFAAPS